MSIQPDPIKFTNIWDLQLFEEGIDYGLVTKRHGRSYAESLSSIRRHPVKRSATAFEHGIAQAYGVKPFD